ncbi:MAG TPA: MATE family efflux transporter [Acidimicrobiales bacterium]|jgi:putative MATE family efflux protein|nr:MATE family efflux transporter [Acidimicrobiales bacterium]
MRERAVAGRGDSQTRPLDRRIVAMALPALGALLVEPIYNLTDSAIVGHLGRAPLGALAIASGSLNIVWWTTAFVEMATVTLVAQSRGAGDLESAAKDVGAAYVLALLLGVVSAAFIALAAPGLTSLLGGKGAVAHGSITYLRIAAIGLVPLVVTLAGTGHMNGLGNTRRPFEIALVSNFLNVVLEVVLVYVVHLGIAGSAWGTVAAQVVSAAFFVRSSRRAELRPSPPLAAQLKRLARDGLPLTVRTVALGAALLASTAVAARFGAAVLAGHQIALQIWLLLALALDALAVPAQVLVGEAIGRRDPAEADRVGRRTLRLGLVAGAALGALTMALAVVIPYVFSADPSVRHQAMLALLICGAQQPLAALAFVLDGLLLGASEYRVLRSGMLVALLGFAPVAGLVLGFHVLGILGPWLALSAWLMVRTAYLMGGWRRGRWRAAVAAA